MLYSFAGGPNDGQYPYAPLINVTGTLYGTTSEGGSYGSGSFSYGTLFSITTAGSEHVLHKFGEGSDGIYPLGSLLDVKGKLYGTTESGGTTGRWGTVFVFRP